jgi:hypothetical protein
MRLRTDDDIYRARLVYLGPPGYTLPVQLSYAQYGVFIVLVPAFMMIHYLFTFHFDLVPAWEIALSIVLTRHLPQHRQRSASQVSDRHHGTALVNACV